MKDFLENVAPFAAMAAIPALAPGAAGAAGTGVLGTTPYAAPAMGAFGSADMVASLAAPSLMSAAPAVAAPGTIETMKGLDFINGVPQNFGAGVESLLGNFTDSFSPNSLLNMGMPQQNQRPAAIMNQIKPVGRMAPRDNEPTEAPYSQPSAGRQPTPEELEQIKMLRAMGRI